MKFSLLGTCFSAKVSLTTNNKNPKNLNAKITGRKLMAYTYARLCFGVSVFTLALAHTASAQDQENTRTKTPSTVHYPGMREPHGMPSTTSPWEGPYAGVTAGYNLNTVKTNSNVNGQYIGTSIPTALKGNVAVHGFEGGAFAGYGRLLYSDLLAAFELSAELGTADEKIIKSSYIGAPALTQELKVKIQKKESFGAAVRVGKIVNGFLPYAKLGVAATRWRTSISHSLDGVSTQKSKNNYLPGLQAGFGAEMPVSEKVRIRAEYSLTLYPSMTTKVAFANGTASYNANAKIRPLSHTLKVGIAMPFRYN
jgi:opacity protein-like surface antigen